MNSWLLDNIYIIKYYPANIDGQGNKLSTFSEDKIKAIREKYPKIKFIDLNIDFIANPYHLGGDFQNCIIRMMSINEGWILFLNTHKNKNRHLLMKKNYFVNTKGSEYFNHQWDIKLTNDYYAIYFFDEKEEMKKTIIIKNISKIYL